MGRLRTSLEAEVDIRGADDKTKNGADEDGTDGKLVRFFGGIGIFREGVAVIDKDYITRGVVGSAVRCLVLVIRWVVSGGLGMFLFDW